MYILYVRRYIILLYNVRDILYYSAIMKYILVDYHHSSGRCAPRTFTLRRFFFGKKLRPLGNVGSALRIFLRPGKADDWMGGHGDVGMERQT